MKEEIKLYYQNQVDSISIPTIPSKKSRTIRENIKLLSCIAATFLILFTPLNRTSPIREVEVTKEVQDIIKEEFSLGLLGGMEYFNNKRRVYE